MASTLKRIAKREAGAPCHAIIFDDVDQMGSLRAIATAPEDEVIGDASVRGMVVPECFQKRFALGPITRPDDTHQHVERDGPRRIAGRQESDSVLETQHRCFPPLLMPSISIGYTVLFTLDREQLRAA